MARTFAKIAALLIGVAVTLAAAGALYLITNSIERMSSAWMQALAVPAALAVGMLLLVTAVFIAVKLAVAVGETREPPKTAKVDVSYLREQTKMENRK